MPKYLTTTQYRRSQDGMLTSKNMFDEVLASYIQRAEADIDSYMQFDFLLGGFEPHQNWYQEPWDQTTLKTHIPNQPVPFRNTVAYKIQVSNVSTAGAGFFANISPGDVTVNIFHGYVEIVPLQAVTYAMTPVLIALGMNPPVVQIDYTVGYYLSSFSDTMYDSGDGLTFRALRGFWASTYDLAFSIHPIQLPSVPPKIYINGVLQTAGYTVNFNEGSVTFSSPQVGASISADYCYQIPDPVKAATIAQVSFLIGQSDLNRFGMQGVELARNDHQEIRRQKQGSRTDNASGLCFTSQNILDAYVSVPIG